MSVINWPILYINDPLQGRPLFKGQIFVGIPDLDPEDGNGNPINSKQLRVVLEDGTKVDVGQPFILSQGGNPVYNGKPVRLDVDGNYSIKILNKLGAQVYYIENVFAGKPVTTDDGVILAMTLIEAAENTLAIEGQIVQITDRADGQFEYKTGQTPNTFDIVAADKATLDLVLRLNEKLPTIAQLGAGASESNNSLIMQYAVDNFRGFYIDLNITYDTTLNLPALGAKIYNVGIRKELTYSGADGTFGINTLVAGGSYQNDFRDWTLKTTTDQKLGFDARRVRYSSFARFQVRGTKLGCYINSSWNTKWTDCEFINNLSTIGSVGLHFFFDVAETFNVVNSTKFTRCLFNLNDTGIKIEAGGDGINFSNCGIEANSGYGVVFQGLGGSHSLIFNDGCYIEANQLGSFLWDKTGAGSFLGVVIENNYIGMDSDARAGIIEFQASNGALHSISIKNNTMRDFGGTPSQNVLLDVNGATMADIYIDWQNNGFTDGTHVPDFDKDAVDWRYLKTDVKLQLTYINNVTNGLPFVPAYSNGEITISTPEFGQAMIQGTFIESTNTFSAGLNITAAIPLTLRPANLDQWVGAEMIDASTAAGQPTIMLTGGVLKAIGFTGNGVSFSHGYQLDVNRGLKSIS